MQILSAFLFCSGSFALHPAICRWRIENFLELLAKFPRHFFTFTSAVCDFQLFFTPSKESRWSENKHSSRLYNLAWLECVEEKNYPRSRTNDFRRPLSLGLLSSYFVSQFLFIECTIFSTFSIFHFSSLYSARFSFFLLLWNHSCSELRPVENTNI